MRTVAKLASVLAVLAGTSACLAQVLNVDWKLFGTAPGPTETMCFYDAKSLAKEPDSKVRVWAKCISKKAMDDIDTESPLGKSIIHAAAERVAHYYVPPIALVQNVSQEDSVGIASYEASADLAGIQPEATVLYEIDCERGMARNLSVSINKNGQTGFNDHPGTWFYTSPASSGAALQKIVCSSYQ
jgi:hypothetical protein